MRASFMMAFPHGRVPNTGLGTKEEKAVNECSPLSSSSLPPPCPTGQRLEKAGGDTHRILQGWPGLSQAKGGGAVAPHTPHTLAEVHTHTTTHTDVCSVHTHIGLYMFTHSLAHGQLQLHGHRPAPQHLMDKAFYQFLEL